MKRKRSFTSRFRQTETGDAPLGAKVKKILVNFLLTNTEIESKAALLARHKMHRRVMKDTQLLLQKAAAAACGHSAIV
jgi:hypothetical protein